MADILSNFALAGGIIDPSSLIHIGGSLIQLVQTQRKKALGPSSGHTCDGCRKELYTKADRYKCIRCPDFDSCAKCFPGLRHPRHDFVRIPAAGTGDIEVVLNGMPQSICDGCGAGWGGMSWMCADCTGTIIVFCPACFPARFQKHPEHTSYVRYVSLHYPAASYPLACRGCRGLVRDSLWTCTHCPDTATCTKPECYAWLQRHAPGHWRFENEALQC